MKILLKSKVVVSVCVSINFVQRAYLFSYSLTLMLEIFFFQVVVCSFCSFK